MSTSTNAPVLLESEAEDGGIEKHEYPPASAVNVAKAKKEPPPEKPEHIRMRSYVLVSFWAIIIFLGLPIWWRTTTIYRANLPLDQMMDWADGRVGIPALIYSPKPNMWIGMSPSLSTSNIYTSRIITRSRSSTSSTDNPTCLR
jgi:hypothetical protein